MHETHSLKLSNADRCHVIPKLMHSLFLSVKPGKVRNFSVHQHQSHAAEICFQSPNPDFAAQCDYKMEIECKHDQGGPKVKPHNSS